MNNVMGFALIGVVASLASGQLVAESRRMVGSEVVEGDFFGSALAIGSGGVLAVGGAGDSANGLDAGEGLLRELVVERDCGVERGGSL